MYDPLVRVLNKLFWNEIIGPSNMFLASFFMNRRKYLWIEVWVCWKSVCKKNFVQVYLFVQYNTLSVYLFQLGFFVKYCIFFFFTELQFQLENPSHPDSVCSLPCGHGKVKKHVEGESCCWTCHNCGTYQVGFDFKVFDREFVVLS